jgi:hypothetical protein
MSLTAAPEGWHGHLHRRRPSGDLPRSPPHHRELSRLRGLPPAPSSPGEVGLSAWLTPRSRRVAVLRADGIKKALYHRRFFYLPFSAGPCSINGCVVRDPASRPHPAARPRRSTSPWHQRPPSPTPPTSWGVPSSGTTSLLSGEHPVLPRRPTGRGKTLSASKAAPSSRRPSDGGVPSSCWLPSRAPPHRSNTALGTLEGIPRREGNPALPILPASYLSFLSILSDHRDLTIASDAPSLGQDVASYGHGNMPWY